MGDINLINLDIDYYNKVISNIFICGWDENTIINYNQKEENIINNIKVLFSIPFNSNFNYLDVYFI
jgi:hypothetical protein